MARMGKTTSPARLPGQPAGGRPPLLTHREARALLAALASGASAATVSLDLGRSEASVALGDGGAVVGGAMLSRSALADIAGERNKCFEIVAGGARAVSVFSPTTGWVRSLMPTDDAPTTVVAGFPMHRIRGATPLTDTAAKVRALGRPRGRVLDTATGLGYSALELAKTAAEVVTLELDPAALELARRNPWSAALFASDRVRVIVGDAARLVATFESSTFAAVLHDPPTVQLAGELYSAAFYRQLRRVLKPGGRLFHYVGDPTGRAGASLSRGVSRRLGEAGFRNVRAAPRAFGVTASAARGRGFAGRR